VKRIPKLQKVKVLELITALAALSGIIIALIHGNLYDYFFNLFSIPGILNFRLLYVSLLTYSALALVVFSSLFFFREKNSRIRLYSYFQGWLFLAMAASSYELIDAMMNWSTQTILTQHFSVYLVSTQGRGETWMGILRGRGRLSSLRTFRRRIHLRIFQFPPSQFLKCDERRSLRGLDASTHCEFLWHHMGRRRKDSERFPEQRQFVDRGNSPSTFEQDNSLERPPERLEQ
jgi:hypothetical protein